MPFSFAGSIPTGKPQGSCGVHDGDHRWQLAEDLHKILEVLWRAAEDCGCDQSKLADRRQLQLTHRARVETEFRRDLPCGAQHRHPARNRCRERTGKPCKQCGIRVENRVDLAAEAEHLENAPPAACREPLGFGLLTVGAFVHR